jgi:DNA-binding MltR family transcriptional regulator
MSFIEGKSLERYFNANDALIEFQKLFAYDEPNDRSIAIVGGAFLDTLLENILLEFFPEDKEVDELLGTSKVIGTFVSRIRLVYCLGLIEKSIKEDLKLIGKIRNKFAHQLSASFEDPEIEKWVKLLKWHKIMLMDREPPLAATPRDIFQVGVNTVISYLNGVVGVARGEKRKVIDNS